MPKEDRSRRRLGLATSGAVAAGALTAALALGANLGLLGFAGHSERAATVPSLTSGEPAQPEPTVPAPPVVETRVVDVPVHLPVAEEAPTPAMVGEKPVDPAPAAFALDVAPSPVPTPVDYDDGTDDLEDHEDEDEDNEPEDREDHADEDHPVEAEDHEDELEDE